MTYAIIQNGICENIIEAEVEFAAEIGAVEIPEGYGIGDAFNGAVWEKAEPPPLQQFTPAEMRERAYETLRETSEGATLIEWDGERVTVDKADALWMYYAAEGSEKADELQTLIHAAKEYIRSSYPDSD